MKQWRPMTVEELSRAEERLRHPSPGGKIEAAQRYGIDLTLLISKLRRTPVERAARMEEAILLARSIRDGRHRRG